MNGPARVFTLVACLLLPTAAFAQGFECRARLHAAQSIPMVDVSPAAEGTIAVGRFTGGLDLSTLRIVVRLFGDTDGPIIASHIHCGVAGAAGPIALGLDPFFDGTGRWTGNAGNGHISPVGPDQGCPWTINNIASLVAVMQAGGAYMNVHTTANPPGEIRGQLFCDDMDDD